MLRRGGGGTKDYRQEDQRFTSGSATGHAEQQAEPRRSTLSAATASLLALGRVGGRSEEQACVHAAYETRHARDPVIGSRKNLSLLLQQAKDYCWVLSDRCIRLEFKIK